MPRFDPSVMMRTGNRFTVAGGRGSVSFEFFEVGGGGAKIRNASAGGFVPWPTQVAGLGLSAVPLSGALATDNYTLRVRNAITLAEAFLTFQAFTVYAGIYGTIPFQQRTEYRLLKAAVEALPRSRQRTAVLRALDRYKNSNAFEISYTWCMLGNQLAFDSGLKSNLITSLSTPQAAVGCTTVRFASTQMIANGIQAYRAARAAASNPTVRRAADSTARALIPGYGIYRWLTD